MKKADVLTSPAAEQDIDEIVGYLLLDDPNAALSFLDELDDARRQLSDFPESGSMTRTKRLAGKGYRFVVVLGYLALYTFQDGTVRIMRIIHASRNYGAML